MRSDHHWLSLGGLMMFLTPTNVAWAVSLWTFWKAKPLKVPNPNDLTCRFTLGILNKPSSIVSLTPEGQHSFCRGAIPNSPQRISSQGAMNFHPRLSSCAEKLQTFRLRTVWSLSFQAAFLELPEAVHNDPKSGEMKTVLSSVTLDLRCFHDMLLPPNCRLHRCNSGLPHWDGSQSRTRISGRGRCGQCIFKTRPLRSKQNGEAATKHERCILFHKSSSHFITSRTHTFCMFLPISWQTAIRWLVEGVENNWDRFAMQTVFNQNDV